MRGGGSKAVWIFSENSSVLVGLSVPKGVMNEIKLKGQKANEKEEDTKMAADMKEVTTIQMVKFCGTKQTKISVTMSSLSQQPS